MKSVKEGGSGAAPIKFSSLEARRRQDARVTEMVNRDVPERLFDLGLQRSRDGRFAAARRSMQKDDIAHALVPVQNA
jgi:hypothetical protein